MIGIKYSFPFHMHGIEKLYFKNLHKNTHFKRTYILLPIEIFTTADFRAQKGQERGVF